MKALFICDFNQNRSKTAANIFKEKFETQSAGLYSEKPVTEEQLEWADIIFVMEDEHIYEISKRFPNIYTKKRIYSLGISNSYHYMHPALINILKYKVEMLLK